ncbi:hypothetical protein PAECIP112173_03396 [Paenibacillus sp. JJ-100]|uniref:DUF2577 family protein n=1 Tax=Paenibacillus sp. JJ-100 TaxID=2974896 RepID=UPI0022FF51D9|nr:DUF2577 family protein [Paenibacillus sp. JJ-100]CAI6081998.1 hypothetical protein PAECIP112173_03396 [Paenibacillus sp. JJ-100]
MMLDVIKKAAVAAVDAKSPVQIMYGNVTSTQPLEITVEQRFALRDPFLVIPESATQKNWMIGDSALMLRVQGGDSYVVLDRLVKP